MLGTWKAEVRLLRKLWLIAGLPLWLFESCSGPHTVAAAGAPSVATAAEGRPTLKWGQTNASIYVTLDLPKDCDGKGIAPNVKVKDVARLEQDRITILRQRPCEGDSSGGGRAVHPLDLELREDILVNDSHIDVTTTGALSIVLRKAIPHRWDRLLWDELQASVSRDWRREDRNLLEEDEYELPRAQNIKKLSFAGFAEAASRAMVVAALRFPWCIACEEKDKAFVKASKVIGSKASFSNVLFISLDAREEKEAVRRWGLTCEKDACPLHVFKPDEPFDEPYTVELQLLYEMDEYAMMADPMAGAPGHTPKPSAVKPNFERFEQDLSRLLHLAVVNLNNSDDLHEFRRRWDNAVVGYGVDGRAFRWAARGLRGEAAFALAERAPTLGSSPQEPRIELWAHDAPNKEAMVFPGAAAPLDAAQLQRFIRVHSKPLLRNYSWNIKKEYEATGLAVAVLWVNYSDANNSRVTAQALTVFENACMKRRGTNSSQHVLCVTQDESYAYYQREYGNYEPYPYPFLGLARKLGYGEGMRYGFPFKEPLNESVPAFFAKPVRAAKDISSWISRVLADRISPSHESGNIPAQPKWIRGDVQDVVWKTYQQEINGSTADVLLELYDDQRKTAHLLSATMRVVAMTLKDYSSFKVARMETSANYVPPVYGRKQHAKETEYYWVPPSIVKGEATPGMPVRYTGPQPATAERLLRFLKKHSISHWSLPEALEAASDLSVEIMGQAKVEQREDDRADAEKQEMIQKMMKTLQKEKGLVDVGNMMGLKKATETMSETNTKSVAQSKKRKDESKAAKTAVETKIDKDEKPTAVLEKEREQRRLKIEKEERRFRASEQKEKEKRKERREKAKAKQLEKAANEKRLQEEERARQKKKQERLERERLAKPKTPLFAWGQLKDTVKVSINVPSLRPESLNVTLLEDEVHFMGNDTSGRLHILRFELREFIVLSNSTWKMQYSEEPEPKPSGVLLVLQKALAHRWDRLAQNIAAIKPFMRKDWVQDDGDLEEEEEIDLPMGQNIKRVTAGALDTLVMKHSMAVAALRFPWCDKCTEKDKQFAKAARGVREKEHLNSIAFAVVDVREEKRLGRLHNATCDEDCKLLIFKADEPGEPYFIPGKRFVEEIEIECYKHLLPVVNEVEDKERFDRLTSAFDTAIVGFFRRPQNESGWFLRFKAVARKLRGHALFGAVFEGRQPHEFGINHVARSSHAELDSDMEGRPLVLLFKPKEQRHVEFEGELTLERLTHFSRVLSLPIVSTYDLEMRKKYEELRVPLGMLWLDGEDAEREENRHALEVLHQLASRFSGHLVFVQLNNTRDAMLMRPMGLDPRRVPSFGISRTEGMQAEKFAFDRHRRSGQELSDFWLNQTFAFQELEAFCASFLNGSLETAHESAELPASYQWPGHGYVHDVVWKQFQHSIMEAQEDFVLFEIYSPFRAQQRTHVIVLDLVAEALKDLKSVKVARMDAMNNYVPSEFGKVDKEKSATIFLLESPSQQRPLRPKRYGSKAGKAEAMPERILRFLHRETRGFLEFDLEKAVEFVNGEAHQRVKRLRALEKDYEKKMQDEWMQKEIEEFERYKRLGKFDNLPPII